MGKRKRTTVDERCVLELQDLERVCRPWINVHLDGTITTDLVVVDERGARIVARWQVEHTAG